MPTKFEYIIYIQYCIYIYFRHTVTCQLASQPRYPERFVDLQQNQRVPPSKPMVGFGFSVTKW